MNPSHPAPLKMFAYRLFSALTDVELLIAADRIAGVIR